MSTSIKTLSAAFRAALFVTASLAGMHASAGIVYNWVTESFSDSVFAVEGRIEIANSFWPNGTLDVPGIQDPNSRIFYGCNGSTYVNAAGFYPGCTALTGIEDFYFNVNNRNSDGAVYFDSLKIQASLSVNGASPLSGRIAAESALKTNVRLEGAGNINLWTIAAFQSDLGNPGPTGCRQPPYCTGATGRWVIDRTTIPVPEPTTLALVAAAFVGATVSRRRKSAPPLA